MEHRTPEQDRTRTSRFAATALLVVLAAVSFIPPQTICGIELRRANILADLMVFEEAEAEAAEAAEPALFDEEEFRVDLTEVAERIAADTLPQPVQITFEWNTREACDTTAIAADTLQRPLPVVATPRPDVDSAALRRRRTDTTRLHAALIPIEDFDTTGMSRFTAFCEALLDGERPVRIAFLGDSFVEGDILTADLRELLQMRYGGGGTGFAPMASPLTGFRRTVSTQSRGWTAYNIMQYKSVPQALRDRFYLSGWVCQPADGASTRWACTDARKHLDRCNTARILFVSREDSRAEVVLNDGARRTFEIEGDPAVRQIVVRDDSIRSLTFRLLSGAAGTVGYGAIFEEDAGGGVCVDNYSIRSNNGQAMFRTDPSVNAQIDALLSYDLVVLQYGLNIMHESGVKGYGGYGAQIEKMIAYVRECFHGASGTRDGRQRPLGANRRRLRADGRHPLHDRLPAPCGAACGRRLLADGRGHALAGRHGAVRAQRLGRQGLPHTSTTPAAGVSPSCCSTPSTPARPRSMRRAKLKSTAVGPSRACSTRWAACGSRDRLLPAAPHVFAVGLPTIATDTPPARHGTKSTHDDPPGHRQPPRASRGAARLRRLVAADLQQRPLSVPFRRLHARLRRAAPRDDDGPHRLRDPLLALLLLQVERHLPLCCLIFAATSDFLIARALHRTQRQGLRRLWVAASVAVNLGMLGYFKYTNFLVDIGNQLFGAGFLQFQNIFLPVGISFFVFQSMSYTIDIYRRQLEPLTNWCDYLFYLSFFPQLVAGPIVRARDFIPPDHAAIR